MQDFGKQKGRPLRGRPFFIVAGSRVARPAGLAQSISTWRIVRRFYAPEEDEFPIELLRKLIGMSSAPWSICVEGPLTKVLQHHALHLRVGAVGALRGMDPVSRDTPFPSPGMAKRNDDGADGLGVRTRRSWTDFWNGALRAGERSLWQLRPGLPRVRPDERPADRSKWLRDLKDAGPKALTHAPFSKARAA